jgi:hypothetical protein
VGVIAGVGNGVGVSVGGNHTIVGVKVAAFVGVFDGSMDDGVIVGVTIHAHKNKSTIIITKIFFILIIKINTWIKYNLFLSTEKNPKE